MRLALICHAPTAATRGAAFPADEPLDAPGLAKAGRVTERFGGAARCRTSPAAAARQTAAALGLPAETVPALRDWSHGTWAGRSLDAVQADDPEGVARWLGDPEAAPHGGESLAALIGRVGAWLDAQAEGGGTLVGVTHAGVVKAAVAHVLDAPPRAFWRVDVSPLSVTWFSRGRDAWTLVALNRKLGRARAAGGGA